MDDSVTRSLALERATKSRLRKHAAAYALCRICRDERPASQGVTRSGHTVSRCIARTATPPAPYSESGIHWHWRKASTTVDRKRVHAGADAEWLAAQDIAPLFSDEEEDD